METLEAAIRLRKGLQGSSRSSRRTTIGELASLCELGRSKNLPYLYEIQPLELRMLEMRRDTRCECENLVKYFPSLCIERKGIILIQFFNLRLNKL